MAPERALPRRPWLRRAWLRRAGLLWLAWLLASTIALNGPWVDGAINRRPERFRLDWAFAVSPLPGWLQAWGVRADGGGRRTAFAARAPRVSAWLAPWALARRELRLAGVHAHGLAVTLGPRVEPLPPPPARPHPWTVALPALRASGPLALDVDGRWRLRADGELRVDLAKVLSGGALSLDAGEAALQGLALDDGARPLLVGASLEGRFALAPLVLAEADAGARLRALALDVALAGRVPGLDLDAAGAARDGASTGRVQAALALRGGQVLAGSRVALALPLRIDEGGGRAARRLATLRLEALDARGAGAVDAAGDGVAPVAAPAARLRLTAALPPPAEGDAAARADAAEAASVLDAALALPMPALVPWPGVEGLLAGAQGHLDADLRIASVRLLRPWLARWPGLAVDAEGRVLAALRVHDGALADGSTLEVRDATLRLAAAGHALEARIDAALAPAREGGWQLPLRAVSVRGPGDALLLRDANARLLARADPALARLPGSAALGLRLDAATVPDLRVFNPYFPGDAVALAAGRARLDLALDLRPGERHADGLLDVRARDVGLALAGLRLDGDADLRLALAEGDLAAARFALGPSRLALRDVRFAPPSGRAVEGWWLEATAAGGRIDPAAAHRYAGGLRLAMRDLGLLIALFADRGDTPRWLLRLVDAGRVEASARLALGRDEVLLDDVRAGNRLYDLDARLRLHRGGHAGAMHARLGLLGVAIGLHDGGRDVVLAGAADWFAAQPPLLPPADAAAVDEAADAD